MYEKQNIRASENLSACHFGHACHRYAIPALDHPYVKYLESTRHVPSRWRISLQLLEKSFACCKRLMRITYVPITQCSVMTLTTILRVLLWGLSSTFHPALNRYSAPILTELTIVLLIMSLEILRVPRVQTSSESGMVVPLLASLSPLQLSEISGNTIWTVVQSLQFEALPGYQKVW